MYHPGFRNTKIVSNLCKLVRKLSYPHGNFRSFLYSALSSHRVSQLTAIIPKFLLWSLGFLDEATKLTIFYVYLFFNGTEFIISISYCYSVEFISTRIYDHLRWPFFSPFGYGKLLELVSICIWIIRKEWQYSEGMTLIRKEWQ